jgi:Type II secretion system (T2SS), protein N
MSRGRPRRARLHWWHAALFVVAFAVTVFTALPARWAATAMAHATGGQVRVVAASGSPWAGRGDLILRVDSREVVLNGAAWRWLPARVFAGELAFKVRFDGTATGDVIIARRMSGFALRDAEVKLPIAAVAEGVRPLRGWSPGGTLVFRTRKLDLGPRGAAGDAELVWQNASTGASPLGDFRCLLQAVPGLAAQVTVATLRGPLHFTATGEVGAGGALRLRGTASSEPAYRDRLGPLLLVLGHDRGDGAVAFEIALPPRGPA